MADIEFTNSFGTFELQDAKFITNSIDGVEQIPQIVNNVRALSNYDGSVLENQKTGPKIITVVGILRDSSSINLESEIDDLKKELLRDTELDLKITRGSDVRTYKVILDSSINIDRSRHTDISHCRYSIKFLCLSGKGEDSTYVNNSASFTAAGSSSPAATITPNFDGTIKANLYWKLTFSTNSNYATEIVVKNISTGYSQVITAPGPAFRTLEFDDVTQKLTLDGTDSFYLGRPLEFGIGAQSISVYITYATSAPTGTFQVKYLPKFA